MSSTSEHKHPGGVLRHDHEPTTGDKIGEAVGGVSGALTGAAVGSPAGPIGTIIGGIAGAVGGWWAGRTVAEAAAKFNEHDDSSIEVTKTSVPPISSVISRARTRITRARISNRSRWTCSVDGRTTSVLATVTGRR
jgi:phage tail tape-measure protein